MARASWMAIVPIPDEPPWTSSHCPGASPADMKTFDHTVQATSGSAAASTSDTPAGTGSSWPAGTATRAAYPPPESSAQAWSPTAQPVTFAPTAATRPLHSSPRYAGAPGGGG